MGSVDFQLSRPNATAVAQAGSEPPSARFGKQIVPAEDRTPWVKNLAAWRARRAIWARDRGRISTIANGPQKP